MWILPKQLHTSAFVPDTEALRLDSTELSEICARSLFQRSKPSAARTWSAKWKRDSWTQHLSGRILNPSHGQSFVTAWTSSLAVIPASPSAQPESGSAPMTLATSGLSSQTEFDFFAPASASSRMSKDTSASDSERSLESWNQSVTKRRGEYSARLKSAHRTSGSASSSWPTSNARDWKDSITGTHPPSRPNLSEQTLGQAVSVAHGQAAPANPSTDGSRQGLWRTPSSSDGEGGVMEMREGCAGKYKLRDHVVAEQKSWATATVSTGAHRQKDGSMTPKLDQQVSGKLNPRWVETLMGLPVGWVMPSCASPVTIEQTNFDSSATESCLPQPSELFAF